MPRGATPSPAPSLGEKFGGRELLEPGEGRPNQEPAPLVRRVRPGWDPGFVAVGRGLQRIDHGVMKVGGPGYRLDTARRPVWACTAVCTA